MDAFAAVLLAVLAGYGTFLLYTAIAFGWVGVGAGPSPRTQRPTARWVQTWMVQAGLSGVRPIELAAGMAAFSVVGAGLAFAVFGGAVAPAFCGAVAAGYPIASARTRRLRRRAQAREVWPRLIEEIRLQATTMGRSIPQALFEVGRRAPEEMQPAFADAQREWLLSTDFERTVGVLRQRLADATADVVCETLLVANDVGGSDLGQRLSALVEDRIDDLQGRKDAEAKQAGARFARRFVLLVPLGMALAGLTIGSGRAAYQTRPGQALVVLALVLVAACWFWAGQVMRLPAEQRVFSEEVR